MLGSMNAHATIPVRNLGEARNFYEQTLGLLVVGEREGDIMFRSGDSHLLIYESTHGGTNKGTSLSWEVNEPAKLVDALKARGVRFEHYDDIPGVEREGDLHRMGPMVAAWFQDPDGNTLCIGNAL